MIKSTLKGFNWRLYGALLFMGLCPTIYTTVRTYFIGQLPNEWAYSIAGQLSWVNLLYEIINEAIILPLFFFMGNSIENKPEYSNKIKTGLILSGAIYTLFAAIISLFANQLLGLMAASPDIISASADYIRLESVANIFGILNSFALVALVATGSSRKVYALTGIKVVLCIVIDVFLVSYFPLSLKLGVNGIAVSNIIVNISMLLSALAMLAREQYFDIRKTKLSFGWAKQFVKLGGISGLESFVRNIAYMLMISRMVNMVGEQGTYWVANNFIWGWLLLPVTQLGELIKQETGVNKSNVTKSSKGYFVITGMACALWLITIPLYKPFMGTVLGYNDTDKLFELVLVLLPFYILYAFQNVFDSIFYGTGKIAYMLFESVITNSIYYGIAFVTYLLGMWSPSLIGIALLFGFGNAFDAVVSWLAYRHFMKHLFASIKEGNGA